MSPMNIAHLNGGPKDDETMALEETAIAYNLIQLQALPYPESLALERDYPRSLGYRRGCYAPRRDTNGDLVPHDLTGVVEWDWRGWEAPVT